MAMPNGAAAAAAAALRTGGRVAVPATRIASVSPSAPSAPIPFQ